MASTFSVLYSMSATPLEQITYYDGTQTAKTVHSNIDRCLSGSIELSAGSVQSNVQCGQYTLTDAYQSIYSLFSMATPFLSTLLIVVIVAADTGVTTPDVRVYLDGDVAIKLSGVGDMCVIPLLDLNVEDLYLKSTSAATLAVVDVLIAGAGT